MGVVGAVVIAQQHRAFFQIEGGVALQKEAGSAVAAGRDIDGAARRAGGKGGLELDGVVRHAVGHQAVAGGVHKERLCLGGEGAVQGLALGFHGDGVLRAGQQGEEGEDIGVAGLIDRLAVQPDGEGVGRAVAQAVFKLQHGAAGGGADERQIHDKTS